MSQFFSVLVLVLLSITANASSNTGRQMECAQYVDERENLGTCFLSVLPGGPSVGECQARQRELVSLIKACKEETAEAAPSSNEPIQKADSGEAEENAG